MKEITHKDWVKNPTDRLMWVWDNDENKKERRKVIYFNDKNLSYPIIALSDNEVATENFKHCAEIEEPGLMTHKELARWLCEKPFREFKYGNGTNCPVYKHHTYIEDEALKEVCKDIRIRDDDGPWLVPYKEIE